MNKKFVAILLGFFALAAVAFFYTLYEGSTMPSSLVPPAEGPSAPPAPKITSVTLTIYKSNKGNTLVVQWQNLPDNTVALNVLRKPTTSTSSANWAFWKRIPVSTADLASGSASFNVGNALLTNYTFTVEAIANAGNGNGNGGAGTTPGQIVIWVSSSTKAIVATSTPPSSPNLPSTTNPTNPTPSSSNSSTPPSSAIPSSSSPSSPPPPAGTPYYTPQVNIEGYGPPQSGNFWVQYVDQKIEIGWQNLPPQTTRIVILRSVSDDGPWDVFLSQESQGENEAYTIQVVDNAVGQPFYYEMNTFAGTSLLGTYGPVYLPPTGQ